MLNTEHFTLLAGNPEPWDTALIDGVASGESLTDIQERQHLFGRRCAVLVAVANGMWAVAYDSSLDDFAAIGVVNSRDEAIALGKGWANEDPDHRNFYARKTYLAERSTDGQQEIPIRGD